MNAVSSTGKRSRKYNHPGTRLPSAVFLKLLPAVARKDTVVLTGRLPGGMKDSTYADWIKVFGKRGVRTVVDTSGKPLAMALRAVPSFFKVNLFEFSEACGRTFRGLARVPRVLPIFLRHGLDHGAVTNGQEGALVWAEGRVLRVHSLKAGKGLVVGAGDAFLAGYLKAWEAGRGLEERARWACAAASVVARYGIAGFKPGLVAAEMEKVKVERLKAISPMANSDER
jgi:fructose-1-phosphate kinase PfkB-like protein